MGLGIGLVKLVENGLAIAVTGVKGMCLDICVQAAGNGFKELEGFLCELPLEDNNAVFNLCCHLCSAYERKAFRDGLQYGAHLINELSLK